jgi:hypothetical protein
MIMKKVFLSGLASILIAAVLFTTPYYASESMGTSSTNLAQTQLFAAKKTHTETTSENWAGYAAQGSDFSEVSGSWVIPTVQPGKTLATDAAWVGIGGVSSQDLIQSGTQEITINGQVQYQAWTEVLPAVSKPLNINVHPGDAISVDIAETSVNKWRITFANVTSGQIATKDLSYTSSRSSAEWIEEAPSDSNGVLPLDNFGSITFSNASALHNGKQQSIAATKAKLISLVDENGLALANTSALNSDGFSFSVTRSGNKQKIPKNRIFRPMETWTHKVHKLKT